MGRMAPRNKRIIGSGRKSAETNVESKSSVSPSVVKGRHTVEEKAEDLDDILGHFSPTAKDSNEQIKHLSGVQIIWNILGAAPLRTCGVLGVLILLFVLKSGEDAYHSLISGAHSLDVNPYETLHISPTATKAEIKQAYRKLSLKWHPDRREDGCDDQCRKTFKDVNEAYQLLADDKRRILFDQTQKTAGGSSHAFFTSLSPLEYVLTQEAWDSVVQPSLKFRQLWTPSHVSGNWALLIANPRSEATEHLIPLWTDLASRFYGRISFMRVDATSPLASKLLPVRLALTPAIMMLTPGGVPFVYDRMLNFQPRHLVNWLNENVQDVIRPWGHTSSTQELAQLLINHRHSGSEKRLPVVLTSSKPPSTLHKAIALRTASIIDWIYLDNTELLETVKHSLPVLQKSTKGVLILPGIEEESIHVIQLSAGTWQLDKMDLREVQDQEDVNDSPAALAHKHLLSEVVQAIRALEVPIFDESYPLLCPVETNEERVICALRTNITRPLTSMEISNSRDRILKEPLPSREDVVEVDEAEDDDQDLEFNTSDDRKSIRKVQFVHLDPNSLRATGSALAHVLRQLKPDSNTFLLVDSTTASFKLLNDKTWTPLPAPCHPDAPSRSRVWGLFSPLSTPTYHCAPRWRPNKRALIRYWCANHTYFTTSAAATILALILFWPKKPVLEEDDHNEKSHSD